MSGLKMENKRISLFCGHYGSGKTNVAVNYALALKNEGKRVSVADLDIVNPYFRTLDSKRDFEDAGIHLICSSFANSNVDLPALPDDIYLVTNDKSQSFVLDIGGDDRGALALGRLTPEILKENNYEMFFVVNCYRPLTADAKSALEVMAEIEAACKIKFTAIVNNSNLGEETKAQDVLNSVPYAKEISRLTGLPIAFTAAEESIAEDLQGKIENLFPITLQEKYY